MLKNTNYTLKIEIQFKGPISKTQLKKIETIFDEKDYKKPHNNMPFSMYMDRKTGLFITIYQQNLSIRVNDDSDYEYHLKLVKDTLNTLEENVILPEKSKTEMKFKWDINVERLENCRTDTKQMHIRSLDNLFNYEEIDDDFIELHPLLVENRFLVVVGDITFSVRFGIIPEGYTLGIELIEVKDVDFDELFEHLLTSINEIYEKFTKLIQYIAI